MGFLDLFKKKETTKEPYVSFVVVDEVKGPYANFEKKLLKKSLILLVIGRRGSGKTALGFKFLELFHNMSKKKCHIVGYNDVKLPFWVKKIDDVQHAKINSVVLIDEGALAFSSRDSMKDANKMISRIMAVARHKNLTLIFISQNSAMIDVNILRLVDSLVLKEPSLLQSRFERKALRDIYTEVHDSFKGVETKAAHFFIYDDDFQGLMTYGLPSFWSDKISTSFKNK
ncbi:MAG: zonular occludens toxin domain-containing protein [Nanoarchaeota archaeon]